MENVIINCNKRPKLFSSMKETAPGVSNISYEHRCFQAIPVEQTLLILVGEGSYSAEEATIFSLKPLICIEIKGTSFNSNPLNSSGDLESVR